MLNLTKQLNDLMSKIQALHEKYQSEDNIEYYDDDRELTDDCHADSESAKLFADFQRLVNENPFDSLEFFKNCSVREFVLYTFKHSIICDAEGFYIKLCEIWESKAPKEPKELKMQVLHGLLETNAYVEGN